MPLLTRRHALIAAGKILCGAGLAALQSKVALASIDKHRVAAPDRAAAQTVLALGIIPIASVSAEFFNEMGIEPVMPANVVDSGNPVEPNLEVLKRLSVELIVTATIDADVRAVLARVAPVFPLEIYVGREGALDRAKAETVRLADVLGVPGAGKAVVDQVEAMIAAYARRVGEASSRRIFLVALAPDGRNMTVYGRNSIMYDVMSQFGIRNAWNGATNEFGFTNAGIEELSSAPDAAILHIDYGWPTDAALQRLSHSPFWINLPMVAAGRVYRIPRFEVFGSLPSAPQFAALFAQTLLRMQTT
ncbi:ABC transporter substrate-binding protein [Rhizobium lusitanum]|uniref:ABC transporter substrate-binding protein n=1 Tax=Rhizobium lusitanum TaxID=293958 RepID=A0A6L9UA23_9HYPH|nr:ABC transporter substrate-binding protein [Rhizobium lusitanum]